MPSDHGSGSTAHGVRVGLLAYTIWGLLTVYWKQLSAFRAIELIGWRMLCAPVISFGLGWAIYDEPMPADRILGFAFVWVALGAVIWDRFSASRRATVAVAAA